MLSVRPITPEDEAAWRDLWRGYLNYYETTLSDAVYANSFRRLCDPKVSDYRGLLAVDRERPVGLAHVIFHSHGWILNEVTYLQDLYVDPQARGKGAGRALIEAVYALADAEGAPNVYWLTQDFNTPARLLYDRVATLTPFIKYQR